MKPFFMQFKQGENQIAVNMNQVCYMTPSGSDKTCLIFTAVIGDEPAYLIVDESFDNIGKRSDWSQR